MNRPENLKIPQKEGAHEKWPSLRDIIKIDGRWAQLTAGPSEAITRVLVKFLDTEEVKEIDFGNYRLVREIQKSVAHCLEDGSAQFADEELSSIFWGSEEKKMPRLKLQIRVFGEYQGVEKGKVGRQKKK